MNWAIAAGGLASLASLFIDDPKKRQALNVAGQSLIGVGAKLPGGAQHAGAGAGKANTGTTGKPMPSNPPRQLPGTKGQQEGLKNNQEQLRIQNEGFKKNQQIRQEIGDRNRRIMGQGKSDVRPSSTMNIQETGIVRDEDKDPYRFLSGRTRQS